MKLLFWLPSLLLSFLQSLLPRRAFTMTYAPSTEVQRRVEQGVRNTVRKAAYKVKR